jgi:hypothetical protein
MRSRLLPAIAAAVGLMFSSGSLAAPPLPCSSYATVAAWAAAGSCVDNLDGDLLLTYVSSTGTFPSTAAFAVFEVELAGTDMYVVSFDFGVSGWAGGGSVQYRLTSLNQERIGGANFDTVVQGTGAVATKEMFDVGSSTPFLTLTSTNGSRDPLSGETPFPTRAAVVVIDSFNLPGAAVYFHADNSAAVAQAAATAVPVDSSWTLVTLAFLLAMTGLYQVGVQRT